jgi:mRNA interferase MazF
MNVPSRGEVWYVDLEPVRGHEQGGRRPVLVISSDQYNRGPSSLVLVIPITSTQRGVLYHVCISAPEGGLSKPSDILCDAVRSVSKTRFGKRLGSVSAPTMKQVEERLRLLQGL